MKRIVSLLLLLLCAGCISQVQAQIREGDVLISHSDYEKLKAELAFTKKELAAAKRQISKFDSLHAAFGELMDYHEASIRRSIERHQLQEQKIKKLEQSNSDLKKQLDFQKARTNEFKFAYANSGRFKDKAQVSALWAGLMSVCFLLALNENHPEASYWMAGGSAALTVGLSINLARRAER